MNVSRTLTAVGNRSLLAAHVSAQEWASVESLCANLRADNGPSIELSPLQRPATPAEERLNSWFAWRRYDAREAVVISKIRAVAAYACGSAGSSVSNRLSKSVSAESAKVVETCRSTRGIKQVGAIKPMPIVSRPRPHGAVVVANGSVCIHMFKGSR